MMIGGLIANLPAFAESNYHPIRPTAVDKTITLTGHDLTIDQLVDVARNGAKVQLSPEAKQRQADNHGLLLEAAAEGIAVYWFNRGAGDQRETIMFSGDPMSPKNKAYLEKSQLQEFRMGAVGGYGPEVDEEEIVRAMMLVRANAMTHNAPSPQLAQMLLDLLNQRITPVVQSRGTLGEGDLAQLSNVGATMVGAGDAYYQGSRMSAAGALAKAGLKPIQPFAADTNALTSSDAYATGIAALTVDDAERALDWADLIYAMDLNGMNSSITPLSTLVQRERPFKWLNWEAARVREMIKGSYLFADDPHRIIQDPESLRASSIRQASAWQDWGALRDAVVLQMNSSDHNPAVRTDLSPEDSWEMSTPQMMKYYVKGGKYSNGKHGYIVSNANWDPYPMANKLENFVIALANMDIAVALRIDRFFNPFFTQTNPAQVLHMSPGNGFAIYLAGGGGFTSVDLQLSARSRTFRRRPESRPIVLGRPSARPSIFLHTTS
jgi:histidine ammonia-lyase